MKWTKTVWSKMILIFLISLFAGCSVPNESTTNSDLDQAATNLPDTSESTRNPASPTLSTTSPISAAHKIIETPTPLPKSIVLPINRQIPPSDIQSHISWYDGGASGAGENSCEYVEHDLSDVKIVPLNGRNEDLYEGKMILVCVWLSDFTAQADWSIQTPDGTLLDGKFASGSGFVPNINGLRGLYRLRLTWDKTSLEKEFTILPPPSPTIWVKEPPAESSTESVFMGELHVGSRPNRLFIYYSGFAPQEILTSVWYAQDSSERGASYLTSWQLQTDSFGSAMRVLSIPDESCIPDYSVLSALGTESQTPKWWSVWSDGWNLDLVAATIYEIYGEADCQLLANTDMSGIDYSTSVIHQLDKGTIQHNDVKFERIRSPLEAHNWLYFTSREETLEIRVDYLNGEFPRDRIVILDPEGSVVHVCGSPPINGCSSLYGKILSDEALATSVVQYVVTKPGNYVIRLDALSEKDIEYRLSVSSSTKSESSPTETPLSRHRCPLLMDVTHLTKTEHFGVSGK